MYSGPASGLWTSPNLFTSTPAGSLAEANNVYFSAPGVLEPRRGMSLLSNSSFGDEDSRANAMTYYGTKLVIQYDSQILSLKEDDASPFVDFDDDFVAPGSNRMRFVGAARSLFFNTTKGLTVFDGLDQPYLAGNPQGLNVTAFPITSSTPWMLGNTAVAYRFTICSKDAFGRVVEGPPSGRTILRNYAPQPIGNMVATSGSNNVTFGSTTQTNLYLQVGDVITLSPGEANFPAGSYTINNEITPGTEYTYDAGAPAPGIVNNTILQQILITRSAEVTCWLPDEVTTNNFIRVYRSDMTESGADTPSDELWLCYESAFLTASNVSDGFLTFEDVAPQSTIDVPLYTNPNSGEGILQANYQPPLAEDIAYFANRMWFANTTNKHSMEITLIGCGAPEGLQNGDAVTFHPINGGPDAIFIASTTVSDPDFQFQLYTDGDPGFNIQRTAQALVDCMNQSSLAQNSNLYGYYVSSETGAPGKILVQAREFGDEWAFQFFFNGYPNAWSPQPPEFFSPDWAAPESSNNRHPAGLWNSRLGLPEAVPLVNYLAVESDNDPILRIFPLQYRLLIFKTSGIYALQNSEPFTVTKISDYRLLAPDSLGLLDERVYALTDQGLIVVGDGGVVPISIPIDDSLSRLSGPESLADLQTQTVGVAYRSARQYLCWMIQPTEDENTFSSTNEQAYVYSTLSGGFTRYTFGVQAATVDPTNDKLVVAPTDSNQIWAENRTYTNDDFVDLSFTGTLIAIDGSLLTLSSVEGVTVGDVIKFAGTGDGYIVLEIDEDATTVTVLGEPEWNPGITYTVYEGIPCEVTFNAITNGEPALMKNISQCTYLFRENGVYDTLAAFQSEIQLTDETVDLYGDVWGEFAWGESPYGNPAERLKRINALPVEVGGACQLTAGFSTRQAFAKFEFLGVDLVMKADTTANRG